MTMKTVQTSSFGETLFNDDAVEGSYVGTGGCGGCGGSGSGSGGCGGSGSGGSGSAITSGVD